MALQAEQRVVAAHAKTIIGYADKTAATSLDFYGEPGGLGIERVFDQFFDHTGGAFHHFAGGNLIGHLFRQ